MQVSFVRGIDFKVDFLSRKTIFQIEFLANFYCEYFIVASTVHRIENKNFRVYSNQSIGFLDEEAISQSVITCKLTNDKVKYSSTNWITIEAKTLVVF